MRDACNMTPVTDIPIQDWDDLFNAVKARLKLSVGDCAAPDSQMHTLEAAKVRAAVLDCVAALEQLHAALSLERVRRRTGSDAFNARLAPVQSPPFKGSGAEAGRAFRLNRDEGSAPLPEHGVLGEQLEHAVTLIGPHRPALALLCLDLDGFKEITDAHGLETADELLRIVAARLTRAVRSEDRVSRSGVDAFACLLAGLPAGRVQLSRLACKLFDAVSNPIAIGRLNLSVRPRIGIAIWPMHGATATALLESADAALQYAKRNQTGYAFADGMPAVQHGEPRAAGGTGAFA